MQPLSSTVLRVGIGLVIIWFGLQQLSDPSAWLVHLPQWTASLSISQLSFFGLFIVAFSIFLHGMERQA